MVYSSRMYGELRWPGPTHCGSTVHLSSAAKNTCQRTCHLHSMKTSTALAQAGLTLATDTITPITVTIRIVRYRGITCGTRTAEIHRENTGMGGVMDLIGIREIPEIWGTQMGGDIHQGPDRPMDNILENIKVHHLKIPGNTENIETRLNMAELHHSIGNQR